MTAGKLRILFFLNSRTYGGVEEVVAALAKGLDRRRYDVHLAAPPALLRSFQSALEGAPVHWLELSLRSFKQTGCQRRLLRYLRQRRIQLVNSHMFYATLFAAPLARLAGVPAVVETTHGPEAWRTSWWKRSGWVDRWVERLVTANIAVSEANRRYLIQQKRYPAEKIWVVPNGRDLGRFEADRQEAVEALRRRYGLEAGRRLVVCVGRLEEQKGHRYLLAAWPGVIARFPEAVLLLVGEGSLRARLEAMAAEAGLAEGVLFAGFSQDVVPYYLAAELVVLPSLYEGMPLAAIEAGAAGRPIVATGVDGTPEVVEDGRTGLLVPPRSPEALEQAICRLLGDPSAARAMGQAARQRVRQHFSLERQIELTSRVYEAALGRQAAA